jgi:membrane peptidoglycan carboxypeptidase
MFGKLKCDLKLIEDQLLKGASFSTSDGVKNIIHAVLVAEDRRFFLHHGIDFIGIARAILTIVSMGRIEGASTIEQQLVRTIRSRYEITLYRKITECILAILIAYRHSKISIVSTYLDIAYFGWMSNGLVQASHRLNIDINHTSKEDAAILAAMLKAPMPRTPSKKYIDLHSKRVSRILSNWDKVKSKV